MSNKMVTHSVSVDMYTSRPNSADYIDPQENTRDGPCSLEKEKRTAYLQSDTAHVSH